MMPTHYSRSPYRIWVFVGIVILGCSQRACDEMVVKPHYLMWPWWKNIIETVGSSPGVPQWNWQPGKHSEAELPHVGWVLWRRRYYDPVAVNLIEYILTHLQHYWGLGKGSFRVWEDRQNQCLLSNNVLAERWCSIVGSSNPSNICFLSNLLGGRFSNWGVGVLFKAISVDKMLNSVEEKSFFFFFWGLQYVVVSVCIALCSFRDDSCSSIDTRGTKWCFWVHTMSE